MGIVHAINTLVCSVTKKSRKQTFVIADLAKLDIFKARKLNSILFQVFQVGKFLLFDAILTIASLLTYWQLPKKRCHSDNLTIVISCRYEENQTLA